MYDNTIFASSKNMLMLVTDTPDASNCIALMLDDAGNYNMMLITAYIL